MIHILPNISGTFVDVWVIGCLGFWVDGLMIVVVGFWVDGLMIFRHWILSRWLNVVIFVQFVVEIFAGQYEFTELEPGKIDFTFRLVGVWRSLNMNM